MTLMEGLQQAQRLRLLRPLDVQFAQMVASEQQPALMLAAALVSRDAGEGHVCLPLEQLHPEACFSGGYTQEGGGRGEGRG
ncbi:MAG TPA: hypothetical protein DEA76_12285, partial [Erwinia persicina]|nr:hypothetical protein [Erwinia persicina]